MHGYELGLRADGISIGTATSYDRTGPLGTCAVTALSNARRQVDLAATSRTGEAARGPAPRVGDYFDRAARNP
ncbi:hypothetical protein [Nocardia beijingensis]|uniref:hypothetical protein n=1 Tax=Nocardia beijingensis TaxID=95162 RepID=UPI00082E8FDB